MNSSGTTLSKFVAQILLTVVCVASYSCLNAQVNHPTLIYTTSMISRAKQAVKNDTLMARYWKDLQLKANGYVGTKDLSKADYLVLAYRMTGDKKYGESLKKMLLNAIQAQSWGDKEMLMRNPPWHTELQVAHRSYAAAIAYDAIYNVLNINERKEIAKGLQRLAVEPAMNDWLSDNSRIHCLNSMGHNWWSSCVCMGGLLALSLENEIPTNKEYVDKILDVLPEWFDFNGDVLQHKARSFDREGGQYESLNYSNFGIQEACLFLLACKQASASKSIPNIPQLDNVLNYACHFCYPRSGALWSLNFGDSHKNVAAESSLEILYALGYAKNDDALWYFSQIVDEQHRDGFFHTRPFGFLYMPEVQNAPKTNNMKCSILFPDLGIASLRNSWKKDATMLGVKSGTTWNHSHADANSLILFHKGIDIIKDAGNCSYGNSNYRNYFFQSQAHNVVLVDGEGQSMEQQYHGSPERGYLYDLIDGNNIKYVLADGTGPMSDKLSRNFRHFLWWDNVIYIIDDLCAHKESHFEWVWHPGGNYKKDRSDIEIVNGKSAVILRPIYPQQLIPSGFLQDYPDDLTMEEHEGPTEELQGTEKYFSFKLPALSKRVKGLTAIILKDSTAQQTLPVIEKRQGENWIGVRIKYKNKITDLYINQLADGRLMHSNSWIDADGWTTDAYMFGVSYDKNDKSANYKELFVDYGSVLRRNSEVYFSSFSKLTFIDNTIKGVRNFHVTGQPKKHFQIKGEKSHEKIMVNDVPCNCNSDGGLYNIRN